MVRKTVAPSSILLIVILSLSVLVGACGPESSQKGGGDHGGSAPQQGEQASGSGGGGQLTYIGRQPRVVYGTSYVGPLTEVFGDVYIGKQDFVASNSIVRAAPGNKVTLGDESNVQDNVVVRAQHRSVA